MFAVRGIAVSFSIFVLFYCVLSVAVSVAWRRVRLRALHDSANRCDLLFALRLAPFVSALGVTLAFAVPSFLLLEPRAVSEPLGGAAVILGCCGVLVILAGSWNAAAALVRASQTIASWSGAASVIGCGPVSFDTSVSVLRSSASAPPLAVAGVLRPTVWLSRAAEFILTERELESALRHEFVHVRRRDNLRKLILRLVAFPGMAELESAWREATEIAADDAAVSSVSEALDLAAALIKLSRLAPLEEPAVLAMALVRSPMAATNARVERLLAWTERRYMPAKGHSIRYAPCAAAALVVTFAVTYRELLLQVHLATEWFVR